MMMKPKTVQTPKEKSKHGQQAVLAPTENVDRNTDGKNYDDGRNENQQDVDGKNEDQDNAPNVEQAYHLENTNEKAKIKLCSIEVLEFRILGTAIC